MEKFIWYVGHRNSHANFLMARYSPPLQTTQCTSQETTPAEPLNQRVFTKSLYFQIPFLGPALKKRKPSIEKVWFFDVVWRFSGLTPRLHPLSTNILPQETI